MDLCTSRVFFTIFGQCNNVLNYKLDYMQTYDPASGLSTTLKWMFDGGNCSDLSAKVCARFGQENGGNRPRETCV